MEAEKIGEQYLKNAAQFSILEAKEDKNLLYLSVLRFFSFTGGLLIVWLGFTYSTLAGILLIPVVATAFLFLLKIYSERTEKKEFMRNLAAINRNESGAVSGDLSAFEPGEAYKDTGHDFSNDVDLFGNESLFQYLNRTVTSYGSDILAEWLSNPYALSKELVFRQEAIRELAVKDSWRHEFMAYGFKKTLDKSQIITLLEWMEEEEIIRSSTIRKILIWMLPLASVLSLLFVCLGILSYPVFTFIFLINLLYVATGLKRINTIHNKLSSRYYYLSSMEKLLKIFDNEQFNSKILSEIKQNISGSKVSASVSVRRLSRLIQAFDSRMNFLVGFVLNGLLLWDYHSIYRLEKWKSDYKKLFPVWLEMLGQIDAYISIGNYAYNNPGFAYPCISDDNTVFSAKKLGHQLIEGKKRVCNDFILEHKGTVCVISGANMAGKSTFLRTVAVNYILAMTGAPVCAEEMKFIPFKLFTSMRTTDSLSNNESYFYAELKRLKLLKSRMEDGEPVLFILDEILKGTNSADKSLGSKLFLGRIIKLGGTGLLATHDTSIGEMENDHPGSIINKCFEVEIDGDKIIFDYKLQNGITHKMNAAVLMKQMGILD